MRFPVASAHPSDTESVSRRTAFCLFFVILGIFCFSFWQNQNCLQIGIDGAIYRTYLDHQAVDRQPFTQDGVDLLQGNFDAYYPLLLEYLLPSAIMRPLGDADPGKRTTYLVYAIFLFLALYAVSQSIAIGLAPALLGGLLMGVLGLPGIIHRSSQLQGNLQLNPYWSQDIGLSLLTIAAFWAMDGRARVRTALLVLAPTVLLLLGILSTGAQMIFMAPATALYGAASLLDAPRWRDNLPRLAAGLLATVVPVALGVAQYFVGLYQYSAYNFFASEFIPATISPPQISTLWYSPFGKATIILGIAGTVWAAYRNPGRLRRFALVHLVITVAFLVIGSAIAAFAKHYHGSLPGYFEMFIWPYSLLFAAMLMLAIARATFSTMALILEILADGEARRFSGAINPSRAEKAVHAAQVAAAHWLRRIAPRSVPITIGTVMATLLCYDFALIVREPEGFCPAVSFWPVRPTAITETLRRNIALAPGRRFNGVVATITGVSDPSVDWLSLHAHDYWLWRAIGNDHRHVGLWQFGIPTALELFTFITPPYYLVLTDFLARPSDRQMRSVLVFTRIDARMMPLWGVRYVITDEAADAGVEVAQLPVTYTLPTPHQDVLRLIELPEANTGDYSPTEIRRVSDFKTGLAALHDPHFDVKRMLVTDAMLSGFFVPATDVRLTYETYGFRLRAKSGGHSLLVLPVQYSHCWTVEGSGTFGLFRADLWQLGVELTGDLDAKLVFHYGPLLADACRMEDFRDMERLRVADGRAVPRTP